jgi:hypothetical protein
VRGRLVDAFSKAEHRIARLLKRQAAPFIARINKGGQITSVLTEGDLRKSSGTEG